MKLDVKNLVNAPMGQSESFSIELFKEQIDEEVKAERIRGSLKITKLEDELLAKFEGQAKIETTCDRCAEMFELELPLNFAQEYALDRKTDELDTPQVSNRFEIDILEPLRQEILAAIPVKKLCRTDCAGICANCGQNLNEAKCQCKGKE